jgi:hypothetical protein
MKILQKHKLYMKQHAVNFCYIYSIVVDDVDAGEEPEPEPEVNTTETFPASTTDNSTGANKEESDARIKQIQVK